MREGVVGRKPLRLCMLSRPREGRGTVLELETAVVSDPEGYVSRLRSLRWPATGLADHSASTVSMDISGGVQREMGNESLHREGQIFQNQFMLCYSIN